MSTIYLEYCKAGSKYYEKVEQHQVDYPFVEHELPQGWRRVFDQQWCHFVSGAEDLPDQGWKIHVSAQPGTAVSVLERTSDYCFEHGLTFKFIRSPHMLFHRNNKYGDRSASGKFITIYPTEEQLERTLDELDEVLAGEPGPYILSDLRFRDGPLYVRYGGFKSILSTDGQGNVVECIRDPEGKLVPDSRKPVFRTPEWVEIPSCLQPSLDARGSAKLTGFPYRIKHALHFSNGGGVYEAVDLNDDSDVILKEARPFAGLDTVGEDAVARLEQARQALEQLADVDGVPNLRGYRIGHEHHYLIRDHIPGIRLSEWVVQTNPIFGGQGGRSKEEYVELAITLFAQLETLLDGVHEAGVVFGDLHPDNVIVSEDQTVSLIDFEACGQVANPQSQALAAPGFMAPPSYVGVDVDRYALACLGLTLFLPLPILLQWGGNKLNLLLDLLDEQFDLPTEFRDRLRLALDVPDRPTMVGGDFSEPVDVSFDVSIPAIANHLERSANYEDPDRLFPGDITQYLHGGGGIGIGNGAAGVLYALHATGATLNDRQVDWLIDRTRQQVSPTSGFWNGLAGVAYVLEELGQPDSADEVLSRALAIPADPKQFDLAGGDPGLALVLLHFALSRSDRGYIDEAARRAPTITLESLLSPTSKVPGGVLNGPSGLALVENMLGRETGREEHLHRAAGYLSCDLQRMGLFTTAEGTVAPFHRPTMLTTCGTILVANRFDDSTVVPRLETAKRIMTRHLHGVFFSTPGLLSGRAGLLTTLADIDEPWVADEITRHARELHWHGIQHDGGYSFLGELGLRLSEDLATGTAGALLALQSALVAKQPLLPFLTCGTSTLQVPTLAERISATV